MRHFLACLSSDARGFETTATIEINKERVSSILDVFTCFFPSKESSIKFCTKKKFSANGLMITEKNYLEVYPYEKWSDKVNS